MQVESRQNFAYDEITINRILPTPPAPEPSPEKPAVRIVWPERLDVVADSTIVTAEAEAGDHWPLVAMWLLVDGKPYGEPLKAGPSEAQRKLRKSWPVKLEPGEHRVEVQVESQKSFAYAAISIHRAVPPRLPEIVPPLVEIDGPERRVLHTDSLGVTALAAARDRWPLAAMQLLVDGRPFGPALTAGLSEARRMRGAWWVKLEPGEHRIAVQAESEKSSNSVFITVDRVVPREVKPNLYCLAVGISKYPGQLRLKYGHSDAQALAGVFRTQQQGVVRSGGDENAYR